MDSKPIKTEGKAPRKMKFMPKAPIRRAPAPKTELSEDAETLEAKEMMRHLNEGMDVKPKVERKRGPVQVAFGHGATSSSYDNDSRDKNKANASGCNSEKECKEPWNYYSYYPVTLPLRRPYSGNPDVLDEEEFGRSTGGEAFDESRTNPAKELGLLDENLEPRMIFLQLPLIMPMTKAVSAGSHEKADNSKPSPTAGRSCNIYELPGGHMGKLQVYKSGKMKLKLGDTLYDVTPGSDCTFAQDVVAINEKEKNCCVLGELNKRASVTPDVDSIISSMANMD